MTEIKCLKTEFANAGLRIAKLSWSDIETAEKVLLSHGGGQDFFLYDGMGWRECIYNVQFSGGSIFVTPDNGESKKAATFSAHEDKKQFLDLIKLFLDEAIRWDRVLKSKKINDPLKSMILDLDNTLYSTKNLYCETNQSDVVEMLRQIAVYGNLLQISIFNKTDLDPAENSFYALISRLSGIGVAIDIKQRIVYGDGIEIDATAGRLFFRYRTDEIEDSKKILCIPDLLGIRGGGHLNISLSKRIDLLRSIVKSLIKVYLMEKFDPRNDKKGFVPYE